MVSLYTSDLVVLVLCQGLDGRDQIGDFLGRKRLDELAQGVDRSNLHFVLVILQKSLEVGDQGTLGNVFSIDFHELFKFLVKFLKKNWNCFKIKKKLKRNI